MLRLLGHKLEKCDSLSYLKDDGTSCAGDLWGDRTRIYKDKIGQIENMKSSSKNKFLSEKLRIFIKFICKSVGQTALSQRKIHLANQQL